MFNNSYVGIIFYKTHDEAVNNIETIEQFFNEGKISTEYMLNIYHTINNGQSIIDISNEMSNKFPHITDFLSYNNYINPWQIMISKNILFVFPQIINYGINENLFVVKFFESINQIYEFREDFLYYLETITEATQHIKIDEGSEMQNIVEYTIWIRTKTNQNDNIDLPELTSNNDDLFQI